MLQRTVTQRLRVFTNHSILYLHPIQYQLPASLWQRQHMCGCMRAGAPMWSSEPNKSEYKHNHNNASNLNHGWFGRLHCLGWQRGLLWVWWCLSCHHDCCIGWRQWLKLRELCCVPADHQCWRDLRACNHRCGSLLWIQRDALRGCTWSATNPYQVAECGPGRGVSPSAARSGSYTGIIRSSEIRDPITSWELHLV